MRKKLSDILNKLEKQEESMNLYRNEEMDSIELLSDNFSEKVRGGDQEYTPMYKSEDYGSWNVPTVLLDI